MRKALLIITLSAALATISSAAELQGVVVDWNCIKQMVQIGRLQTLKQNHSCSLMKDYRRSAYGLITDDKKFYRLNDPGNEHILRLLQNTPDKDNLKVVVNGDLTGNAIKVNYMTML